MPRARRIRRVRRRTEEIDRIVQAYEASGLSQRAFARSIDISPQTLRNWVCKHRPQSQKARPTLVPVRIVDPMKTPTPFEVILASGRVVRVPPDFDAGAFRRLLDVMEAS